MGYKEFNIDSRYRLYGRYYNTLSGIDNINPFLKAHRDTLDASGDVGLVARYNHWKKLDQVTDYLAADSTQDKYIPLHMQLCIPDGAGTAPHPIAVFIHGQANSFYRGDTAIPEVRSYRGYRYLQQYLAEKGVASISVSVNVASFLEDPYSGHDHWEQQGRLHISFLCLAALRQLSVGPVTSGQQIFFKQSSDSMLVGLHTALGLQPPFGNNSQEASLNALKTDINGKLDFTRFGFMGHSRGGSAVQLLQPYFSARTGTAPASYTAAGALTTRDIANPTGTYNSNTVGSSPESLHVNDLQYHSMHDTLAIMGAPGGDKLKAVVGLQPNHRLANLSGDSTFFMVLASSHDEDVQEDSFNSYELVQCPKAMIFSHGASHARFNTVWRQITGIREKINRNIACQSPIHMLSNAGHENLGKATIGNTMLAGLLGESHRFKFFTGEITASIGQDIERAWKFPFPMGTPPGLVVLDTRALSAINSTTGAAITITSVAELSDRDVSGSHVYSNKCPVKMVTKPSAQPAVIRIPVTPADALASRSHFSMRYTKEIDPRNDTALRGVNLRNYSLQLKAGTTVIGRSVAGADVPSQAHRPYKVIQYSTEAPGPTHCYNDTTIVMQTAELPLTRFLNSGQPVSDLSQVDAIELTLNANAGGSGDEIWFFVDFLLSSRTLPAAPSGFVIP